MEQILELLTRIDAKMTNVVERLEALETNFSLLNAQVAGLRVKVDLIDTKVDQILELMRRR